MNAHRFDCPECARCWVIAPTTVDAMAAYHAHLATHRDDAQ